MSMLVFAAFIWFLGSIATPFAMADEWDIADRDTNRLSAARFPGLPESVKNDLNKRGCTIPQAWSNSKPHNVIRGRFTGAAESDWAALCSVDRRSTILVYRGGGVNSVLELSMSPDKRWLQIVGNNEIGFSREISVADVAFMTQQARWHGGELPPILDHEGINESFIGKASVVYYWYDNDWLALQGAD